VARPRPAAAAKFSACGRGNAVGLTSILDRGTLSSCVVGPNCYVARIRRLIIYFRQLESAGWGKK